MGGEDGEEKKRESRWGGGGGEGLGKRVAGDQEGLARRVAGDKAASRRPNRNHHRPKREGGAQVS